MKCFCLPQADDCGSLLKKQRRVVDIVSVFLVLFLPVVEDYAHYPFLPFISLFSVVVVVVFHNTIFIIDHNKKNTVFLND